MIKFSIDRTNKQIFSLVVKRIYWFTVFFPLRWIFVNSLWNRIDYFMERICVWHKPWDAEGTMCKIQGKLRCRHNREKESTELFWEERLRRVGSVIFGLKHTTTCAKTNVHILCGKSIVIELWKMTTHYMYGVVCVYLQPG